MPVDLLRSLGDDLAVVNAARVSYGKESTWEYACPVHDDDRGAHGSPCRCSARRHSPRLAEKDAGLLNYLMRERHGTPFEMVVFTFRVSTSIAVAREWQRHRIGSFNEVSTRYVEMEPEFYVPQGEAIRRQVGKPGHYTFEPHPDADRLWAHFDNAYQNAYASYLHLLSLGVAKELARNVLPLGLMTQFLWTVNARSALNFLELRTAPTALLEIRTEAQEVERLMRGVIPATMAAFDQHGKRAP